MPHKGPYSSCLFAEKLVSHLRTTMGFMSTPGVPSLRLFTSIFPKVKHVRATMEVFVGFFFPEKGTLTFTE